MDLRIPALNHLLDSWLNEDLGRGDLTRAALGSSCGSAYWIAKQPGVFCGGELVRKLFHRLDESVQTKLLINDGEIFEAKQRLLELNGSAASLVAGERIALNLAMHLSGIATATSHLVAELKGTGVKLADTRKTTPGLRVFEKYAVRCGGGINHRLGLDDAAMLKENHLAWAGGIQPALQALRETSPWPSRIIVETETPEQAKEAVMSGVDWILMDEIPPETLHILVPQLRELALTRKKGNGSNQIVLEASGIDPIDLKAYAATGVDLISSSVPITRSPWIDFSMRFE